VRAATRGTNAGMKRRAEALLLTSLAKGTVQLGMLSCLNITFLVELQLPPFPFAVGGVGGWLARRGTWQGSFFLDAATPVALLPNGVLMRPRKLLRKI
jgi:hypothetical protein